jgi:hypothetical protein
VNSNIAIETLPTLQISVGVIAVHVFEKIYDGEPILTVFSNIGGRIYKIVVSVMCMM